TTLIEALADILVGLVRGEFRQGLDDHLRRLRVGPEYEPSPPAQPGGDQPDARRCPWQANRWTALSCCRGPSRRRMPGLPCQRPSRQRSPSPCATERRSLTTTSPLRLRLMYSSERQQGRRPLPLLRLPGCAAE